MREVSSSCQELSDNAQYAIIQPEKVVPALAGCKTSSQPWLPMVEMPPNAPHEALRLVLMHQIDVQRSPVEGVYGPQSAPLFRQWCTAVTLECDEGNTPPQPLQKRWWRVAKGFMCGTGGQFLLALAVVGHGCDGCCWPVTSDYFNSYACLILTRKFLYLIMQKKHLEWLRLSHQGTLARY